MDCNYNVFLHVYVYISDIVICVKLETECTVMDFSIGVNNGHNISTNTSINNYDNSVTTYQHKTNQLSNVYT